jgi:hypothetical protein
MAFTGRATYSNPTAIAEDVSDIISMISPFETPLLDYLGDAVRPATNVLHEWLEESLAPPSIINSTAITSDTAATTFRINGTGGSIQTGDLLRITGNSSLTYEEVMQVTATAADSITVNRGVGSVGPSSLAPGGSVELISNATIEGADVSGDISQNRTRNYNWVQIYRKSVEVSDTEQAVSQLGDISNEYDHQLRNRTREILRDLEKNLILGVDAGNSFASATTYRTMKGIWRYITSNQQSAATFSESFLNAVVIKSAWDNGAQDLDFIVADANLKREIDNLADSRIRQTMDDETYKSEITLYESSYGRQQILPPNRWMPTNSLMVLASDRINVLPLDGMSFQQKPLATTGLATNGVVFGEYTAEVRNEAGLARANLT